LVICLCKKLMNSFVSGIYELVKVVETESPFVNEFDR